MAYKTFNKENQEINLHDLQDKGPWCVVGASFEETFVLKYPELNLIINPEKAQNVYAPDLLNQNTGGLADLKTQNTPFFLSQSKYRINPQYAVTFNRKDYLRYIEKYPGIEIYFWVDWQAVRFSGSQDISVNPMVGVWRITYENLLLAVASAPLHTYVQRYNDNAGNAKDSYVLDLKSKFFEKIS